MADTIHFNCQPNTWHHMAVAGSVALVAFKFGHSFVRIASIPCWHAVLFAITATAVSHFVQKSLSTQSPFNKALAYGVGGALATVISVGVASIGGIPFSISALGALALTAISYATSNCSGSITLRTPMTAQ